VLTRARRGEVRTLLDPLEDQGGDLETRAVVWVGAEAGAEVVSQEALRAATARYGHALAALGVQPRDVVIIAHTGGLEAVYAFLGLLRIGAIPSMFPSLTDKLDPAAYRANMRLLVRHSGARMVVATDAFATVLAEVVGCPTTGFERIRSMDASTTAPFEPSPDDVAFLQHSSGTTGLQKGVALSHRAVLNQIASYSDALRLAPTDVVVSWLPLYHDMGLIAGFLLPVVQRLPLVLMSPFEWVRRPSMLVRAIHDHGGTLCWLPNFAYNHCARRILDREIRGRSLAGMRCFVNCSEPVLDSSHRAFLERFSSIGVRPDQLGASYAMAENVFAVTQTAVADPPHLDVVDRALLVAASTAQRVDPSAPTAGVYVSCGTPIPDVDVRIEGGLPDRSVGEIQVRSHCMLSGYHGRPDLDADLFDGGWYRTGDLGYLADGELYVVGRKKDLIINGGKNLHPHDLEAIVNSVPGVHPGRAVAFGVPDEREGTELVAVVAEVDTEDPAARLTIGAAIRQAVAAQMGIVASYVHIVGPRWLLKTSSGKIARAANREKWLAERGSG
jgi:acyl-CoA synthetase (AMP-forming)/AMP-acid ligase II